MWIKAGELLVKMVDEDPEVYDKIIKQNPRLSRNILGRFEQIGRKVLDPQLLLRSCPGYNAAKCLPYSVQQQVLAHPVEVATGQYGHDKRLVPLESMTAAEAKQVFGGGSVRTTQEQAAHLKALSVRKVDDAIEIAEPYSVIKGRVTFRKGVKLGVAEMAAILRQMTTTN